MASKSKQNLTVKLERSTIRWPKVLAAKRGTSISRIVEVTIEQTVSDRDAFEEARRRALELLVQGFHLGGAGPGSRDKLHER